MDLERKIGNAKENNGLYYFEDGGNLCRQAQMTSLKSICVSSDNEIMLWHYRLGHPNFQHLKYLFIPNCSRIKIHLFFNVIFVKL